MQNLGDVAMLQAAARQLRRLWPDAELRVVTNRPVRLMRAVPGVVPVPTYGHLLGPCHRLLPGAERWIFRNVPQLGLLIIKGFAKAIPVVGRRRDLGSFSRIVADVDLVVASGGGYLTDSFDFYALPILNTLDLATRAGRATAMLGQGLGPFERDAALWRRCGEVLPKLDQVHVRERCVGPALLREMGVAADRVAVTGDDAVALAREFAPPVLGDALGVNVRRMGYAQVDQEILATLRAALARVAADHGAPLVSLPVSVSPNEADHVAIREMLEGVAGFEDASPPPRLPAELLGRVARCRVVVTGAYHAAVFALSCGIPAVCLVRSRYYADKMAGLADLFGEGCSVVALDGADLQERLTQAIGVAWRDAEATRAGLLTAADRQIASAQAAYATLAARVCARRP